LPLGAVSIPLAGEVVFTAYNNADNMVASSAKYFVPKKLDNGKQFNLTEAKFDRKFHCISTVKVQITKIELLESLHSLINLDPLLEIVSAIKLDTFDVTTYSK
jgi:hypothetical protein